MHACGELHAAMPLQYLRAMTVHHARGHDCGLLDDPAIDSVSMGDESGRVNANVNVHPVSPVSIRFRMIKTYAHMMVTPHCKHTKKIHTESEGTNEE